jgi:hypothetical protein
VKREKRNAAVAALEIHPVSNLSGSRCKTLKAAVLLAPASGRRRPVICV